MNKSVEKYRDEIKKILDEYYELLRIYDKYLIQVLDYVEIPEGMFTGEVDTGYNETLRTWKMIPSDVTEEDISEFEKETGIRLPDALRAYYTSYYHLWECDSNIPENSPINKMSGLREDYDELLVNFGYIPLTWDGQGAWLFCMKVDENNQDFGIYWIDHEELFAFKPETVTAQDIEKAMDFQAENFCEYLYNETVGMMKYRLENGFYK